MPKRLIALCRLLGCASIVSLMVGCASAGTRAPSAITKKQVSAPARPLAASAKLPRRTPAVRTPAADGAGEASAADADDVADAEPSHDALRLGNGNQPYRVGGRSYVPQTDDRAHVERGLASWYGRRFHGRRTASGETYDMHAMTAAHPTLPLPSYVRVRNPANGREVIVRVNDRGPFHGNRVIDLSQMAARKLGVLGGPATVELRRITGEEIRTGAWRRDAVPEAEDRRLALREVEASMDRSAAAPQTAQTLALTPVVATQATDVLPATGRPAAEVPEAPAVDTAASTGPAVAQAAPSPAQKIAVSERGPERPALAALSAGLQGFWVQIGAFRLRDGAEHFQRRVVADLAWIAPSLSVLSESELHRLQSGPYASLDQAHGVALRLREALSLVPVIVERR